MVPKQLLRTCLMLLAAALLLWPVTATAQFGDLDDGGGGDILKTRTFTSHSVVAPSDTVWVGVRLVLEPEWHVNSAKPIQDYLIPTKLTLNSSPGLRNADVQYPVGQTIPLLGEQMSVYENGAFIKVPLVVSADAAAGPRTITGTLTYQGCNNEMCIAPAEADLSWSVTIGDQADPVQNADLFYPAQTTPASTDWALQTGSTTGEETNVLQRLVDEHGVWGYVLAMLLAFGTGFLLSFSPCTYPMIPITVSIFAGQARGVGRGFFLSVLYVLTMAVIYGIMGAVIATVGGVFGAWLAHPAVVGVIVTIFVVFALSMFGLYELQVPSALRDKMASKGGGGGVGGAIVLGAVAALVVSPCVGPFVAGIMLYIATTGSTILGFLILFTFALGLGTLFILIGTFASAIQALPNAGLWMESVKKFFGFILLLMALYFLRTLISTELLALIAGLLFLGAGVFGGGFDRLAGDSGFFPRLKKAFGVLCTLIGIYLLGGYLISSGFIWPPVQTQGAMLGGSAHTGEEIPWVTNLDEGLAQAKNAGKPVLIDTWATWCANCVKLDKTTWVDDHVVAEAARFVPMKLQLEKSDSPATIEFLKLFALRQYSLPTIILIDSQGKVADVIQGYLGPSQMLQRMQAVS